MGGFFHLVDLKQGRMARKIGTQQRNVGGLEAPRNSLELPVATGQSYFSSQDDGFHKYQDTNDWSEMDGYPAMGPIKKLISNEISERPKSRVNSPSVVARLMGVDALPPDKKAVTKRAEKNNENSGSELSKEVLTRSSSVGSALSPSKSFRQISLDSFHIGEDSDADERSKIQKHRPREHPQEAELQKFKKEFEAWQSARFKECSKIVEYGTTTSQLMAQENLNKEKMVLYASSGQKCEKSQELKKRRSLKSGLHESGSSSEFFSEEEKRSGPPTRIVILKPGLDNIDNYEDPCTFASSSEDRNGIEDFLEQVKERLKCELQGKTCNVRGGGIETPFRERPSNPKQIAQRIARQVRESVTKDLSTNLLRSESYRGEFQCSGRSSPEFISRDTRRLLSERLRNVLKDEDVERDSSLVRSLSAPVSGTSFGKLLLEDRHVVTGAHIRRKYEATEKLTMKVKKRKNLKERVSSFKYSLTLRGRLFGRKIHSATEFRDNDMTNGPTVMMNFAYRPENSTEVPPSPASVCSSIQEAYCVSPTTPSAGIDENDLPQAFRDISSNLNELRKQLNELETGHRSEETEAEDEGLESETVEVEDEEEAYIRDLLMASGLYKWRWDTLGKPISNRVFEQVESSYKEEQKKVCHKVLLDLVNEVISTVVGKLKLKSVRKGTGGSRLLDEVWGTLRGYLHPPMDKSFFFFESMVARDLKCTMWSESADEETGRVAKELECLITRDLMEEIMKDIYNEG